MPENTRPKNNEHSSPSSRSNPVSGPGPLALTLLLPPSAARAGLTLEMNVIRYDHGSFSGYYFSPYLNTNSTPPNVSFGDYYIASYGSPTNGSSALYRFTTNGLIIIA